MNYFGGVDRFLDESNIVDINRNKPHKVSEVMCVRCNKRWVATRPLNTQLKDLECQSCGKGFAVETGENLDI